MRFYSTAALAVAGALTASAAPAKRQAYAPTDVDILQFALTLEHIENVFYKQALSTMSEEDFTNAGFTSDFFNDLKYIAFDEQNHVLFLESALKTAGATPVQACTYDFGNISTPMSFIGTAAVVEGVGGK